MISQEALLDVSLMLEIKNQIKKENVTMSTEKNLAKEIVSLNVAAWKWRLSDEPYYTRLTRICNLIKRNTWHPFLIALQEVILGDKYIALLQEELPDYEIITPKSYDASKNRRSAVCCTLVNKRDLISYSHNTLDGVEHGSGRYVYLTITSNHGCYRVLNVHVPQVAAFHDNAPTVYIESRYSLKAAFESTIQQEANTFHKDPDVKFIVVGDLNATPDSDFVKNLAYSPKHPAIIKEPLVDVISKDNISSPTWVNEQLGCANRIDYLLYSLGTWTTCSLCRTELIDEPIKCRISDHAILRGRFFPTLND